MILSKIAVMLVGLAGLCLSAPVKHAERSPFPGYRLLRISEEKPSFWVPKEVVEELSSGQLDFIDITDFQDANPSIAPKSALALPSGPSHQSVVNPLLAQIDSTLYQNNLVYFSSYRNRYYTSDYGVESAEWLFNTVSEMAANRSDITVTKFSHTFRQPSVIAKIQGTSASAESVIIGAHQDSTAGSMPSGSAPGADDDGSGSMGILEIFRILIANGFRPQNTIEFQWYAAEEVGLLGSQAIAQSYSNNKIVVRSMMQLDMIAYDTKESTVGLVTDYVDAETVQFARTLVDEYLNIGWTNTVCGYGCSDHASWNRYGYPSCFPFEAQFRNRNPLIHTTMDTMSSVSIKHAVEFIKLGLAFAVELSYN